jgi:hypothetical protein
MTIQLTDLIFCKANALSQEECEFLIDEHNKLNDQLELEHCPDANTGIDTWSSYQRVILKTNTEARDLVFRATESMINDYMNYLDSFNAFHTLVRESMLYSHMYRLLRYLPGEKIHPHTDHDPFIYGSCTFNLNDNYTGGDFVFWKGRHRVKLAAGEGMIWPADYFWVHEVEPVITGVRYSTNSFLMSVPDPVKQMAMKNIESLKNTYDYKVFDSIEKYNIKNNLSE